MHIHVSALDALTLAAYLLIILAALRVLAARFADTGFGEGLASIIG